MDVNNDEGTYVVRYKRGIVFLRPICRLQRSIFVMRIYPSPDKWTDYLCAWGNVAAHDF